MWGTNVGTQLRGFRETYFTSTFLYPRPLKIVLQLLFKQHYAKNTMATAEFLPVQQCFASLTDEMADSFSFFLDFL